MKVVINRCYGGFGLSHAGMMRYGELKGITFYPEKDAKISTLWMYWTVPAAQLREQPEWQTSSQEERAAWVEWYKNAHVYDRDIPRDDAALIQVVEELGKSASGEFAELKVVEIPDGIAWEISDYDGMERVEEQHLTWC